MKMLGSVICVTALAVSASYSPLGRADEVMVYGAGTDSCGQWTEHRRTTGNIMADVELSWALGFLGGVMDVASVNLKMHFKNVDDDAVAGWLDNYCRAHPLEPLFRATEVLTNKLRITK